MNAESGNGLPPEVEWLSLAIQQSPAAVIMTDPAGRIRYVNRRFTEMTGYLPEEVLGQTPSLLKSGKTPEETYRSLWETLKAGQVWRGELCNRRKDGELYWHSASISPVLGADGVVAGFVAVQEDVTERRRVAEALRQSEMWFRTLIEGAEDLIAVLAPDGTFSYVSPSFERILGLSRADLVGRPAADFAHPDESVPVFEFFDQKLGKPGAARSLQFRFRHADGSWRTLDGVGRNLNGESIVSGTIVHCRDITQQKLLETQYRQAQKMEALGRLVGGVAHDFNNLLGVILGANEFVRNDLSPDHPSVPSLEDIQQAAEQAAALTRQMLAFSRKQVQKPTILDLNELVANVNKMLARVLGADIALTSRLSETPVMIKADVAQLEQVLLNLAVNSRDAMPQGGRLLIETSVVEIDESHISVHEVMGPGRYALLAVSDSGCGMDEATRTRVFEPFFTTKGPGKGTGLGLATVYGIVKQSQGFIWVYSELGHGTVFKIYLPLTSESKSMPQRRCSDIPALRGTETILVAEDNIQLRQFVRRALERCGYSVLAASDVEAVEIARSVSGPIHLLLTDVIMPTIRGPELARLVARLKPEVRVLYMSGYTDSATVGDRALELTDAYLPKPFSTTVLAQKVRQILDRPRAS